jgi:hypothetical protein
MSDWIIWLNLVDYRTMAGKQVLYHRTEGVNSPCTFTGQSGVKIARCGGQPRLDAVLKRAILALRKYRDLPTVAIGDPRSTIVPCAVRSEARRKNVRALVAKVACLSDVTLLRIHGSG